MKSPSVPELAHVTDVVDARNGPGLATVMLYVRRALPLPIGWWGNRGGSMALTTMAAAATQHARTAFIVVVVGGWDAEGSRYSHKKSDYTIHYLPIIHILVW